jgi:hypothetical protein
MNTSGLIYLIGYVLVYFVVVVGIWKWRISRRQERPPVPEKLVRAPGETLRQKLERFDDTLLLHLVASALVPLLAMVFGLMGITRLPENAQFWALLGLLLLIGAALFFSARWLMLILEKRRNHYLGYFGERVVGETLDALRAKGFRIFHDVPALEATPPFNLDHIIVGPTGVFAVETKTRRKGKARPNFEEHKIVFDGQQLVYPWGEDFHGLNEARDRALWLDQWLAQILGKRVPVQPILTFPGWWVEEHAVGTVRVTNPKQIAAIVLRPGAPSLTDEQIETLSRQLEGRCRDVEF